MQVGLDSACDLGASNLPALTDLTILELSNNYITGTLPAWLSELTHLEVRTNEARAAATALA